MSPVSSKTVTGERWGRGGLPSTPPPPAYCSFRGSGPWNMSARRPHRNPGAGRLNTAQVWTDHSNSYGGRHMNVFVFVVSFFFCVKKTLLLPPNKFSDVIDRVSWSWNCGLWTFDMPEQWTNSLLNNRRPSINLFKFQLHSDRLRGPKKGSDE